MESVEMWLDQPDAGWRAAVRTTLRRWYLAYRHEFARRPRRSVSLRHRRDSLRLHALPAVATRFQAAFGRAEPCRATAGPLLTGLSQSADGEQDLAGRPPFVELSDRVGGGLERMGNTDRRVEPAGLQVWE